MSNLSTHSAVSLDFTKPLSIILFLHLRRHQYEQQMQIVPPFVKLYEVNFHFSQYIIQIITQFNNFQNFLDLELDIEESLPKFQELIMNLRWVILLGGKLSIADID